MSPLDLRRPAEVTVEFRERLRVELAPHDFEPRSNGGFVRRRGRRTDRIELSSSHHNAPGDVTCWVALYVDDVDIRKREPTWRAGGGLGSPAFAEDPPRNIADPSQAAALASRILAGLSFFELAEDAPQVLAEVRRRYVAGFVAPGIVVPYLLCRLGVEAVERYATSLLECRPELWPAFVGSQGATTASQGRQLDHGTELAAMLAKHANAVALAAPDDTVRSVDLAAANLRCFFGRQLRAWGEAEAAALLRRVGDERIHALRAAQNEISSSVDEIETAKIILRETTGEQRPPRGSAPHPRLFQYHVLHAPF